MESPHDDEPGADDVEHFDRPRAGRGVRAGDDGFPGGENHPIALTPGIRQLLDTLAEYAVD